MSSRNVELPVASVEDNPRELVDAHAAAAADEEKVTPILRAHRGEMKEIDIGSP